MHTIIIGDVSNVNDPLAFTQAAARAAKAARDVAGAVPTDIASQWGTMAAGLERLGSTAPTDQAVAAAYRSTTGDPAYQAAQDGIASRLDAVCATAGE